VAGDALRREARREDEEWLRHNPEARAEIDRLREKYPPPTAEERAEFERRKRLGAYEPDAVILRMETVEPNDKVEPIGDFTLEEMIRDNAEDEDLVEELVHLRPGGKVERGGGAAPRIRISWLTYNEPGVER